MAGSEVGGHEVVGRGVDEVAGEVHRRRDGAGAGDGSEGLLVLDVGDVQRDAADGRPVRGLAVDAVGVVAVGAEQQALGHGVEGGGPVDGERDDRAARARERLGGLAGGAPQALLGPGTRSETDRDHEGGGGDARTRDLDDLVGLAGGAQRGQRLGELAARCGLERGGDDDGRLLAPAGGGGRDDEMAACAAGSAEVRAITTSFARTVPAVRRPGPVGADRWWTRSRSRTWMCWAYRRRPSAASPAVARSTWT